MRREGFTLIELMIVVAIIAVIAAIAIPSLLNARKSANETKAIATLRSISTSQEQYKTRFGSYASDIADLEATGYLDIAFDAYAPIGYAFTTSTWAFDIGPTTPDDGHRFFFVDQSGVIRFTEGAPASALSPPLQ